MPDLHTQTEIPPVRSTICFSIVVIGMWLGLAGCQQTMVATNKEAGAHLAGAQLYQRLACHGCHSRQGAGGSLGPALDRLYERLSPQEVETQLLTPRRRRTDSRMPSFAFLRTQELRDLVAFVQAGRD